MPAGGGGEAVVIQIELGGWLTCRIWDGMRSLGTVWRIGRSPMKYSMEHSVSRTVVVSECSPPPMCGLGRSEGQVTECWLWDGTNQIFPRDVPMDTL